MSKFDEYRAELEKIKHANRPEIDLADLEKGIFSELGIIRVKTGKGKKKKGTGTHVTYYHEKLESINSSGYFVVHKIHGRTRDVIKRTWFRKNIYKHVEFVINQLEKEEHSER